MCPKTFYYRFIFIAQSACFFFFFLTNKRATSSQLERSNKLHRLCHIWQDSSKHMFKEIFNSSMSSLRPKSVILQRTAYLCTYVFSLESVNFVAFSCHLTVFFFFCFLFSADSSLRVLYCFFSCFLSGVQKWQDIFLSRFLFMPVHS